MKRLAFLYLVLIVIACQNKDGQSHQPTLDSSVKKAVDTLNITAIPHSTNWVDDLNKLKTAILNNDAALIKSYFQFPVNNTNNEIWYLLLTEKEMKEKAISDVMVPFMSDDFDKYYPKLFSSQMKAALAKTNADSLLEKGEIASPLLIDKAGVTTQLLINKDSEMGILSLVFNESAGEGDYKMESSTIYIFTILNDKTIQFKEIRMAG